MVAANEVVAFEVEAKKEMGEKEMKGLYSIYIYIKENLICVLFAL